MSAKRVSTRILGVAAGVTALLGLSTTTALAWSPDCPDHNHGSHSQSEHRTPSQPHHWAPAKPTPRADSGTGSGRAEAASGEADSGSSGTGSGRSGTGTGRSGTGTGRARLRLRRSRLRHRRRTGSGRSGTGTGRSGTGTGTGTPTEQPVPPVVALGIPETPQPESTPVAPKTPEEGEVLGKKGTREERVLGKVGTREEATTPTTTRDIRPGGWHAGQ